MLIAELAQHADCDTATIRYYEREKLLPIPSRTAFSTADPPVFCVEVLVESVSHHHRSPDPMTGGERTGL